VLVAEGEEVAPGSLLCRWDPDYAQVLSEVAGRVEFCEMVLGQTVRVSSDPPSGGWRLRVTEHRGDLNPHLLIRDATGRVAACYYLCENTLLHVEDCQEVTAGTVLARTPLEYHRGRNFDTGGFPRLREVLEVRRPWRATILAEVAGIVQVGAAERGHRVIHVQPTDGDGAPVGGPVEHRVPRGQQLLVSTGERIEQGTPLIPGDPVPQDILRVLGPEAVRDHLLDEIVRIYRAQRLDLDDRHTELVIARMLRSVRGDSTGDTHHLLLGITEAASHSDSFLAPAPSVDPARVLAGAALAGRVDPLTGLKENVVLGGLIPVGTGWPGHRGAEAREVPPPVAPPKKTADGQFPQDRLRPARVRAELLQMLARGHARERLRIGADGTVVPIPGGKPV
jgi:DNA-directed RNA polymerase subunit beta'